MALRFQPCHCALTWLVFCVCTCLVCLPFIMKILVLLAEGPIFMTLFNVNYLLKGLMSKYSYIVERLELQHTNSGLTQFSL